MTDESGVGEVSDFFPDVQPRNCTETDTEMSSDLLVFTEVVSEPGTGNAVHHSCASYS